MEKKEERNKVKQEVGAEEKRKAEEVVWRKRRRGIR